VQTAREEMQTSQEELKSTNEELQSTNEELQSSNEELTTSKEEMQSLNEELQTVNHELQAKVDELSRSNNDMKNLLNSTDIATLFLDDDLRVRRFTTQTAKLIKLIPGDAGRPITDIATELVYPDLAEDAREVLRTLAFREKQVSTTDQRWFTVRIMPYRTLENVIDGLVITFTDATSAMVLAQTVKEQTSQAKQMAEALPNLVWACRPDGGCDYLSRQWIAYTGVAEGPQLGFGWLDRVHDDDRKRIRDEWSVAVESQTPFASKLRLRASSGEFRWFKVASVPIRDEQGAVMKWYGTFTDVDDLMRATEVRDDAAARLASILEGVSDAFLALDDELEVTFVNRAAERMLDRGRDGLLGHALLDAYPDAAGTLFEERCRDAITTRRPETFEAQLEHGPARGWYEVRVYPHARGISVFIRALGLRPSPTAAPDGSDGEGAA
jgi:PAS domain S-box-containing protein